MDNYQSSDRRRSSLPRAYEPKRLNERHHQILRMSLLGYSNIAIAKALGCTPATVSNAVNSGLGRQHSSLLRAAADSQAIEVAKSIRQLAPQAIGVIEDILQDSDCPSAVRLRAAQDALDRAGFAPVKRVDVNNTQLRLTAEDLEGIKSAALKRAQESGLVIDVTSPTSD